MLRKAKSYKIRKTRHTSPSILTYFVSFERKDMISKSNTFQNTDCKKARF